MARASVLLLAGLASCSATPAAPADDLDLAFPAIAASRSGADVEKLTSALAEIHAKIRAKPEAADGHLSRANILAGAGCPGMALESYDRALALRPDYVEALLARGAFHGMHGRAAEAERDFDAVIKAAPDVPDGYLLRAWIERSQLRFSEATRDLAEARARGPGRWQDYHNAGVGAIRDGRWGQAELNFELSVLLRPDHADGWIALSRVHASTERYDRALEDLDRAAHERPGDASVGYARGEILRSLGRFEEAVRAYDAAIAAGPVPIMYSGRGQARAALNDPAGAEKDFGVAITLEPTLREAWVERGRLRAAAGRYDDARDDYVEALRIRASASVLYDLARLHHEKGAWEPAISAYEWALRICTEPPLRDSIDRRLADARARRK